MNQPIPKLIGIIIALLIVVGCAPLTPPASIDMPGTTPAAPTAASTSAQSSGSAPNLTDSQVISATATLSATATTTATALVSPTQTAITTATVIATSTITATATLTPTGTPRATLTSTASVTSTATLTSTATVTATSTITASATAPQTSTARPGTPTVRPSATASPTATEVVTGTATATEEPTITATPTQRPVEAPPAPPTSAGTRAPTPTRPSSSTPSPTAKPTEGPPPTPTPLPNALFLGAHHSFTEDGDAYVVGEVINGASAPVYNVRVIGTFYDAANNTVAAAESAVILPMTEIELPNPFKLRLANAPAFSRYELNLVWDDFSIITYYPLSVLNQEIEEDEEAETLKVVGEIHNDGASPVENIVLEVTFYDADGQVVNIYIGAPDKSTLAPDQTAAYIIDVPDPTISFKSFWVQAQGALVLQ